MSTQPVSRPRGLAGDLVAMHSPRLWELIDVDDATPASPAHDDTRAFVLQKLDSIAQVVANNPLTAPNPFLDEDEDVQEADDDDAEPGQAELTSAATQPENLLPACPVVIVATETVADAPVANGGGLHDEVAEQLRLFRRQQDRVTALVLGAVCCAGMATIGGIAFALA